MQVRQSYARYLVRRGTVYYFRQCFPLDIRHRIGISEIRISLRTGYVRTAQVKARFLASAGDLLFKRLRKDSGMENLDRAALKEMIKQYFHGQLDKYEDAFIETGPDNQESLQSSLVKLEGLKAEVHNCLATRKYGRVEGDVTRFVEQFHLEAKRDTPEFRKIAHEILKANADMLSVLCYRQQGDYSTEEALLGKYKIEEKMMPVQPPVAQEEKGLSLFDLIDKYCDMKITLGKWTGRGVDENPKGFNALKFILGDILVGDVNTDVAMHVLSCLKRMPPRFNAKKYAGFSVDELIAQDHPETLAVKTINLRMEEASGLFKYAVKLDCAKQNYFEGMRLRDDVGDEERRLPFTTADIQSIFDPATFLPYCDGDPARYWIPVIALFTGARLEEIAQLWVEDIYVLDGLVVLDINDNGIKRLKNNSSRRKVPLHSILLDELGFELYVEKQRLTGQKQLFNELPHTQKRFGHTPSKDFREYLDSIQMGPKKTFHSFRHTFIDFLRNKGVRDKFIASMTGHKGVGKSPIPDNYKGKHWIHFVVDEVLQYVEYEVDIPRMDG